MKMCVIVAIKQYKFSVKMAPISENYSFFRLLYNAILKMLLSDGHHRANLSFFIVIKVAIFAFKMLFLDVCFMLNFNYLITNSALNFKVDLHQ